MLIPYKTQQPTSRVGHPGFIVGVLLLKDIYTLLV